MSIQRAILFMMGQQQASRQVAQQGRVSDIVSRPFRLYQPLKQPHEQHVTANRLNSSTITTHASVISTRESAGREAVTLVDSSLSCEFICSLSVRLLLFI